jgi:hypothetical protein
VVAEDSVSTHTVVVGHQKRKRDEEGKKKGKYKQQREIEI